MEKTKKATEKAIRENRIKSLELKTNKKRLSMNSKEHHLSRESSTTPIRSVSANSIQRLPYKEEAVFHDESDIFHLKQIEAAKEVILDYFKILKDVIISIFIFRVV